MASPEEDKKALVEGDENLVCTTGSDIEIMAESGSMNDLYRWRFNMADARVRRIIGLKAQLARLEKDYIQTRASTDCQLLERKREQLDEILKAESPQAARYTQKMLAEQNKMDLRKAVLTYLIGNREEVEKRFRLEISIQGREKATYRELTELIFSGLLNDLPAEPGLSSWQTLLGGDRNEPVGALDLYERCRDYPGLTEPEINIYKKVDMETYYGHLLATISGIDQSIWENYRTKKRSVENQLLNYDAEGKPLPPSHEFGVLQGPLRIFLIRNICRSSTETALSESQNEEADMSSRLLGYFEYFGQASDSLEIIDRYKSLPENTPIMDGLQRIIGLTTRGKIMAVLSGRIAGREQLLSDIYGLLSTIISLGDIPFDKDDQKKDIAGAMAYQFGRELTQQLRLFNSQKKPAEGIPDNCETQISELHQLALYCLFRIKTV